MSREKIDLTGQTCGRWVVLNEEGRDKHGNALWRCKCSCPLGTERVVSGYLLRNGKSQSCGCLSRELTSERKKIDLTGQPYGHLVALYENGRSKSGDVLWHCKCKCGNETDVPCGNLRSGHTTSCGCYDRERRIKHGLYKSNPRLLKSIHTHFSDIREGVKGYQRWTLDPRYPNNAEGTVMFCMDVIALYPEACALYEVDTSLDLDKDNDAENTFRPESIVFRPSSENRSKKYNNLKLEGGRSLPEFCRCVGIQTQENGKQTKQYTRIGRAYSRYHKTHPELIQKANDYLTLLKRLKASLDLLAEVREFAHGLQHLLSTTRVNLE